MHRILILDGVTGAGKSSVLKELQARLEASSEAASVSVILEEETIGDLMQQVRDPAWQRCPTFEALDRVLRQLEEGLAGSASRAFLVERFHLTYFALFPRWEHFERYDARLAQLGAAHVLLTFPEALIEARSIARPERAAEGWAQGMAAWYGSHEAAVRAALSSQRGRWEALGRTALPFLHIDTREQDWPRYAETILRYWDRGEKAST
jgi:hypothetical protein